MSAKRKRRLRVVDNDRNLGRYARFTDTYGATVKVSQSSAAGSPCVWIFVDGGGANQDDRVGAAAAHLSIRQARLVRDALSEWLEDFAP